ncbi:hypothetical protein WJX74_006890 [Apatococcus lobatus]|uniref:Uncharacterized protein n=1 Tax=Apatococcus lobatus TaxID=904363 RepID=A0AAW1R0K2_9CHLO
MSESSDQGAAAHQSAANQNAKQQLPQHDEAPEWMRQLQLYASKMPRQRTAWCKDLMPDQTTAESLQQHPAASQEAAGSWSSAEEYQLEPEGG